MKNYTQFQKMKKKTKRGNIMRVDAETACFGNKARAQRLQKGFLRGFLQRSRKKASSQTSDTHGNCALRKRKTKRCYEHSFQFARGAELLAKASDKGDAQAGYTLAMLHLASEVTGFPDGAF